MMRNEKYEALLGYLKKHGNMAVAFSGGVDSTFLLKAAQDALDGSAAAVTVNSHALPKSELSAARRFCAQHGIKHIIIDVDILQMPAFVRNPPDRCYHCKKAVLAEMLSAAAANGFSQLAEGTNADDMGGHRPGMRAVTELGVKSPLKDIGFTKDEIRALSRDMGLPTWDRPSYACLATRIPYGDEITAEKLHRIEQAEELLHSLGFMQSRVRVHGDIARIEAAPEQLDEIMRRDIREKITYGLKKAGFAYVCLDMQGYRTGSMNETLTEV